ncbi:SPRY domain-containing SOCS box protein 4 [Latimeria chalumnae]|uniref:SplA/ryanodine receptor domain and SOCS box containing 2 n=1 Tax=Latimeria chalumnae TaxID=7897 RepID=M3XL38_LATCH|nr:PREDICTED: SPRY domain-containing SOCS box protein 4-like [Latimeria chalumnae]|eukprot:XP_005997991.1 PREDICTED: SPRY domain-containing SOCS box protein 4-like [Latimeria chalumnae]
MGLIFFKGGQQDQKQAGERTSPFRGLGLPAPVKLEVLLGLPPASAEERLSNAWNAQDCSPNYIVKGDSQMTAHRLQVTQSTDCIRGRAGYSTGLHVWEISWPGAQRGSHAVVGVATAEAPLHSQSYQALVGSNAESWGWELGRNLCHHQSKKQRGKVYPDSPGGPFQVPDTFSVVLDADEGTLSFLVDGEYLGPAFTGLKGKKLYPIISSVRGDSEVTIKYVNSLLRLPHLSELCGRSIRDAVGRGKECGVDSLPLPAKLRNFMKHE